MPYAHLKLYVYGSYTNVSQLPRSVVTTHLKFREHLWGSQNISIVRAAAICGLWLLISYMVLRKSV